MPNLGGWEFVILIGILVLLFGAKRLPEMARSIGQSARVFKGEMSGLKKDGEKTKATDPAPAETAVQPVALPPAAPVVTTPVVAAPVVTTPVTTPDAPQQPVQQPAQAAQPGSGNAGQ